MKNDTKLERTKIFLPFDALKGLKEALREKEKILVDKKILSIEEKEKISKKLIQIKKGMIIKVTDENLIRKTGGIVQGMSGSPIIQNGEIKEENNEF